MRDRWQTFAPRCGLQPCIAAPRHRLDYLCVLTDAGNAALLAPPRPRRAEDDAGREWLDPELMQVINFPEAYPAEAIACSTDGLLLAVATKAALHVYTVGALSADADADERTRALATRARLSWRTGVYAHPRAVAIASTGGELLSMGSGWAVALAGGHGLSLWTSERGNLHESAEALHPGVCMCACALSADGSRLVSASLDGRLFVHALVRRADGAAATTLRVDVASAWIARPPVERVTAIELSADSSCVALIGWRGELATYDCRDFARSLIGEDARDEGRGGPADAAANRWRLTSLWPAATQQPGGAALLLRTAAPDGTDVIATATWRARRTVHLTTRAGGVTQLRLCAARGLRPVAAGWLSAGEAEVEIDAEVRGMCCGVVDGTAVLAWLDAAGMLHWRPMWRLAARADRPPLPLLHGSVSVLSAAAGEGVAIRVLHAGSPDAAVEGARAPVDIQVPPSCGRAVVEWWEGGAALRTCEARDGGGAPAVVLGPCHVAVISGCALHVCDLGASGGSADADAPPRAWRVALLRSAPSAACIVDGRTLLLHFNRERLLCAVPLDDPADAQGASSAYFLDEPSHSPDPEPSAEPDASHAGDADARRSAWLLADARETRRFVLVLGAPGASGEFSVLAGEIVGDSGEIVGDTHERAMRWMNPPTRLRTPWAASAQCVGACDGALLFRSASDGAAPGSLWSACDPQSGCFVPLSEPPAAGSLRDACLAVRERLPRGGN